MSEIQSNDQGAAPSAAEADLAQRLYSMQVNYLHQLHGEENIRITPTKIYFRKQPAGKVLNPETGEEETVFTRRPEVVFPLDVPSHKAAMQILSAGGEGANLILDAMEAYKYREVYGFVSGDPTITSDNFPLDKFTWEALAATAAAQGTSRGVSKEELKAFVADFVTSGIHEKMGKPQHVMPSVGEFFASGFAKCATDTDLMKRLEVYLNVYIESAANAEAYTTVVSWLKARLEARLQAASDNSALKDI